MIDFRSSDDRHLMFASLLLLFFLGADGGHSTPSHMGSIFHKFNTAYEVIFQLNLLSPTSGILNNWPSKKVN